MAETPMAEEDERAFRRLVHRIARQVWTQLNPQLQRRYAYDDIVQIGWVGFLEAWAKFDPDRGIRVSTYCFYRARGKILDTLRRAGPLPQARRQQACEVESVCEQLHQKSGREPELGEIAQALDVSEDEIRTLRRQVAVQEVPPDTAPEPDRPPDQETVVFRRMLAEAVNACVQALERRLYWAVMLRHSAEPLRLEDIGATLVCSTATAQRRLQQAYACLRQCLQRQGWEMIDPDEVAAVAKLLDLRAEDRRGEQ